MSDDTAVFAVTLDGLGVRFVGARHENNAIAMAEGYSYATGELGVALIGRGPATANGLHAAVAASRMGSKVLVIHGDAAVQTGAVNTIGPDYKGFNAQAVLGAAGLTCVTAASPTTARSGAARCRGRRESRFPGGSPLAHQRTDGERGSLGRGDTTAARGCPASGNPRTIHRRRRRSSRQESSPADRRRHGSTSSRGQGRTGS